ncbi:MAG TPA: hypothetical protein VGU66_08035 [Candidatus Elarobacter sp.]|nr:hypothetical protein [Candidatus Elarobacter sp.]
MSASYTNRGGAYLADRRGKMGDVLALAWLILAFAAPNPFALGPTPTPAPSASPGFDLPEIGRVRAATPACAVMRDLIAPAYAAAVRADARFTKIRKGFPKYVDVADDRNDRYGARHAMIVAELDRDALALRDEALVLNRALGDPRFVRPTDPQVVAEKRELQQLYDNQSGRANLIFEFVTREQAAIMRSGMVTGGGGVGPAPLPAPVDPATTAPFGMPPPLRGIELTDRNALDEWAGTVTVQVRASEHRMAAALLPIAQSCR